MAEQKFTAKEVADACEGTAGIMVLVAKKLGCDRSTVWRYAKRYKSVRDALYQADEAATDLAEAKSIKLIDAEYWPAIKHRLDTKGKDRGYAERTEITGADRGPLEYADATLSDEKRIKRIIELLDAARGRRNRPVDE